MVIYVHIKTEEVGSDVVADEYDCVTHFIAYLNIGGGPVPVIPGDVIESNHVDWIEVIEFGFDMSAGPGASAGRGGAPAEFGDFAITKQIDKASPLTGFMSAGGVYISEVILDIGYVGETGFSLYYQYKLEGVMITNVIQTGQAITSSSCTSQPIEEVAFRYNKITWKYIPLIGNSIEAWWNLQTNEGGQQ